MDKEMNIIEELKEKTKEEVEETPAADFFMGIALMVLSAVIASVAWSWPRPSGFASAAGLFPFFISVTLFLMALGLFINSLRYKGPQKFVQYFESSRLRDFLGGEEARLLFLTLSTILFYMIVLLRILPFEAATFIFMVGSLHLFWKAKIYKIVIVSASVTAFYAVMFKVLFGLALPGAGM